MANPVEGRTGMPTQPGLYWARKSFIKWWNYLVKVEGEAPMLHIVWGLEIGRLEIPRLMTMTPGSIEEWGPRLTDPEEIQKVVLSDLEKTGIVWRW